MATDCSPKQLQAVAAAFLAAATVLWLAAGASPVEGREAQPDFGTNQGALAFNGECNDPRFEVVEGDDRQDRWHVYQDAADCHAAFADGKVVARPTPAFVDEPGSDNGPWAFNGVCNDPRFSADPRFTAAVSPIESALKMDSTDCYRGWLARQVWPLLPDIGLALGDDTGEWPFDGECDDPRFFAEGMEDRTDSSAVLADATDCLQALGARRVLIVSDALTGRHRPDLGLPRGFDLGDDTGGWPFDGECDDPRFDGLTSWPEEAGRDATDCGRALLAASVALRTLPEDFEIGSDDGGTANDGRCSDPRFGPHPLYSDRLAPRPDAEMKDASDCHRLFLLRIAWPLDGDTGIVFGDDSGEWPQDDECDDPRFSGTAAAEFNGVSGLLRDATDCRDAHRSGGVVFVDPASDSLIQHELGDDDGEWPFDGECDDPRFSGDAVAADTRDENRFHDATDCARAILEGKARLTGEAR